jgi:diguanylate cyclase (GGDEF)-like protein/PAS domain S-box-containing protein
MADLQLRESEAFANGVLESSKDCIEVIDMGRRLQFMNGSCRKLMEIYGFTVTAGQDWMELWPDSLKPKAAEAFAAAKAGATMHMTNAGLTLDGTNGFWDVTLSPILGPEGQPDRILSVSRDISSIKIAQDELERAREAAEVAARYDSLTGLLNRSAFRERLEQQLKQATSENQTAVLFLDLDEFKSVNDSLGHPAGDQLLREVGSRLKSCLRGADLIARFGGDEFAILQSDAAEKKQTESLAERLIGCLSEPYLLEGRRVVVGVSIGITVTDTPEMEADTLLRRADIALYQAKADGRGICRYFEDGMDQAAEEHQRLRTDLRDAVSRGEFLIYYQPIVEFGTSRVTSFEALVRWQHPRRGLLKPAEFIALAEETGDIDDIGDWLLRGACATAASWPDDISVAVNLSPRQFRGTCLVEAVSRALMTTRLPARRLQLEITESALHKDEEVVQETLATLREIGVRISIDDFGTGYSSLGYLRQFSVDNIKIDRSFVADFVENRRTSAILEAVVTLANKLGISITAEGVETIDQREKLMATGCSHGQGYLFSHAIPADGVKALIDKKWSGSVFQQNEGSSAAFSRAVH